MKYLPFGILALSFIISCLIANYGYATGNITIEKFSIIPFCATATGIIIYSMYRRNAK